MPDLEAECSLDLGCPADEFQRFCQQHSDRTIVVYANTSAEVKAQADWMVTSSIALKITQYLKERGEQILWAPDRHLGEYIQNKTQADMLIWKGSCLVHNEFKGLELKEMKQQYPHAKVLVHPESPAEVISQAYVIGSTTQLVKAAKELKASEFIVETDLGILHKMKEYAPDKTFIAAPTSGNGATCKSCAFCPWMGMNHLKNLHDCLNQEINEIHVKTEIIQKAITPIERMLNFAEKYL